MFPDDSPGSDGGIGVCGWLLFGMSWLMVAITLPFSLCVLLKVGLTSDQYCAQFSPLSLVEECGGLALIGREDQSVATPALLCHKEPARRIQNRLLGALERWFFMTQGRL